MDYLIEKIIAIEEKAQDIIKEAKEKSLHVGEEIEAQSASMHQQMQQRADKRLAVIKEQELSRCQSAIDKLTAQTAETHEAITRLAEEKTSQWIDSLFGQIISE